MTCLQNLPVVIMPEMTVVVALILVSNSVRVLLISLKRSYRCCFKSRPSVNVKEFLARSKLVCRISVMFSTWFSQLAFFRKAISFSRLVRCSLAILRSYWTILNSFVSSTICFTVASYSNFNFLTSSCRERKTEISIPWSKDAGLVFCPFTVISHPNKIKINVHRILFCDVISAKCSVIIQHT